MSGLKSLDQATVVTWSNYLARHLGLLTIVKTVALTGVYLIPIIWLVAWFITGRKQREILLSSMLSGIFAWEVLNRISKMFYYHARPVHDLPVKELLFGRPENSFPSDHTAFLAGIAFFLLFQKRYREAVLLLCLAILVSLSRIAVAVHYPSDIIAGFVTGLIAAIIVNWLHPRLTRSIWPWVMDVAHKLRLA
jgi:undecaprenyl-diphosphatase